MSLARRIAHKVTLRAVWPSVFKRLGTVEGLEHLYREDPFVLVSNHESFYDHFVYGVLMNAGQGQLPAFLTKAESFHGARKAWFEEMGAVPVDRAAPARELLATTDALLAGGRSLVVYPEGTRARTPEMLPFKDGAARFAVRAGVPVVPAAIVGTREVLPVGARRPKPGWIHVAIGEPLLPDPALPRGRRIADLLERSEQAVHALRVRAAELAVERPAAPARRIALLAEEVIERSLAPGDPVPPPQRREQAGLLISIALGADPHCLDAQVAKTRMTGLRALEGSKLLGLPRIAAVRRGAERALDRNPDHLMANYLLGRWHLSMPALLGGRRALAVDHFARAELLGGGDSRYAMALGETFLAIGGREQAAAAFDRVLATPAPDERTARRHERARAELANLGFSRPAIGAARSSDEYSEHRT